MTPTTAKPNTDSEPNPCHPLQASLERVRALLPYLVSAPRRGVVGSSRYAQRLRAQVLAAARDPER